MKKLFFLASCLLVLSSSPTWAQKAPEVITVRIEEYSSSVDITTATSGAAPSWQRIKFRAQEDDDKRITEEYEKVMNTYYQRGFVIQAVIPGLSDSEKKTTTLIFVKSAKS